MTFKAKRGARRTTVVLGLSLCAAALEGCSRMPADSAGREDVRKGVSLSPVGARGTGSTIALANIKGRNVALLADEDERAVDVVDVERGSLLGRTDVGGVPAQLLVLSDGRVLVTVQDVNRVAVLGVTSDSGDRLVPLSNAETDVEPIGLAATPDESTVLVTNRTGHTLEAYAAGTLKRLARLNVGRDPFSVTTSSDGRAAFVNHAASGRITVVSLPGVKPIQEIPVRSEPNGAERRQRLRSAETNEFVSPGFVSRFGAQGFTIARSDALGRVFAPAVLVDPGEVERRTPGYGNGGTDSEVPAVAVVDASTGGLMTSSLETGPDVRWLTPNGTPIAPPCLLPRASAVDDVHRVLFVACAGIDAVVAYDLSSAAPASAELWRAHVASGPTGLAIDAKAGKVVVWSAFDRVVSALPLVPEGMADREPRSTQFAIESTPAHAVPRDVALGRLLFHSSGDPRVSLDGRGCASCHPSARDDGLVWATPRGPRRSKVLAGMLRATAPYSWDGGTADLETHLDQVFERLDGRGGLRPFERRALIRYLESLAPPPSPRQEAALVERGRHIFTSPEAGCSDCHDAERLTDRERHDVGSRDTADLSASFDTPSLRGVANRAPYFHDGRYPTLEALVNGQNGPMGKARTLSEADRFALVAYLRSL